MFDRVLSFMAKKGKLFHHCDSSSCADLFIINDENKAIEMAIQQQTQQIFLLLSDSDQCAIGDYQLKRPLLISRVMSALEQCSLLCNKLTLPAEHSIKGTTKNITVEKTVNQLGSSTVSSTSSASTSSRLSQAILERAKYARLAKQQLKSKKLPLPPSTPKASINFKGEGEFLALVVDDSAAIRKQLEIELRSTTIQADYAVCGEDALEKIQKKQYDLVFLDIIMPGIDGYEVCKTLRKISNYKRTPVIMLSGKVGPLDEVEGILAGASTYLLKPVKHQHFQETLTRISKWLNNFA
jgi:CheY-like chemotaxis protein